MIEIMVQTDGMIRDVRGTAEIWVVTINARTEKRKGPGEAPGPVPQLPYILSALRSSSIVGELFATSRPLRISEDEYSFP